MSTMSIVRGTEMNVGAIFVFCSAIILQTINAAPATFDVGTDNPLIQGAASGDVMLKTPEPLNAATNGASVSLGSIPETLTTTLNDSIDQVQGDHILGSSTSTSQLPNGSISTSLPTNSPGPFAIASGGSGYPGGSAFVGSYGFPATSTIETTTSPLDSDLTTTSGPAATTSLAVADPMIFYRVLTNLFRQQEPFMPTLFAPFSGMAPTGFSALRMPNFRPQIPNIGRGMNDPSLKLVDQQVIDNGGVKGQFNSYESQPDPNTVTKMQTGQFSVNQDGVRGGGVSQHYSSSSTSNSGGSPMASVGTFFGGLPTRFNMQFPLLRT